MARIRRASVPERFASPARVSEGRLRCAVAYAERDGWPLAAMLLPAVADARRWWLAGADGRPLRAPGAADLAQPVIRIQATSGTGDGVVELDLPWPGDAQDCALLLLLHDQIDGLDGDGAMAGRLPPDAAAAPALAMLAQANAAILDRGIVRRRIGPDGDTPKAFAMAGGQFPGGPLDGSTRRTPWLPTLADVGPAGRSLFRLAQRFEADASLALTLLCGNQVCVDLSAGLFDPGHLASPFEFAYQRLAENLGLQRLLRCGSEVVALIDDHEIAAHWEPRPVGSARQEANRAQLERDALRWYLERQRRLWPPGPDSPRRLWSARELGGHAFFFADTRTERECRQVGNVGRARLISPAQNDALMAWIAAHAGDRRPAFLVSSAMLLPRPILAQNGPAMALHVDAWSGWPASQQALLAHVWDCAAGALVFLTGGDHPAHVARVSLRCDADPGREVIVHAVHSSPLYAPYPFAHAAEADFAAEETFCFDRVGTDGSLHRFTCAVSTWFARTGDGFAVLRPCSEGAEDGQLDIEFAGDRGSATRTLRRA